MGYALVTGDVDGMGNTGTYSGIETSDQCGDLCDSNPDCKSYEFSLNDQKCNLNTQAQPDTKECCEQNGWTFCVNETGVVVTYIIQRLSFKLEWLTASFSPPKKRLI